MEKAIACYLNLQFFANAGNFNGADKSDCGFFETGITAKCRKVMLAAKVYRCLAHGFHGAMWWCAFDQSQMFFAPYHWGDWAGLEHGVFDADGNAHPAAGVLKKFSDMLKKSPVKELPPCTADAVCIINDMECGYAGNILARQAGINLKFQAARGALTDSKVYFLPSASERAGISSENWAELRKKVADGAVCYISSDDCILPGLREFCGMQITRRRQVKSTVECVIDDEELKLAVPVQKTIQLESAEVVLIDKNGQPLMLRNKYGKGTVYTLLFALENTLAKTPGSYESAWWKLYRMILPKELLLSVNDFSVILTEHPMSENECAIVAVNCSDQMKKVQLAPAANCRIVSVTGDAVLTGSECELPSGGGALFIVKKSDV
jgi:hypothetical protein